ncbi:hypothetical protein FOMPIDRAFT_91447 [Fomitopsis schrenkii]|uniref:Uncharacterized protein n=1 Tax=Fomitopsis schrenkii TaxID=2126942 RepID=S8DSK0_FOMSC|nr:hypothetical protein FOMPIDRAFT_91447 [Fomitopsis schrenkii]
MVLPCRPSISPSFGFPPSSFGYQLVQLSSFPPALPNSLTLLTLLTPLAMLPNRSHPYTRSHSPSGSLNIDRSGPAAGAGTACEDPVYVHVPIPASWMYAHIMARGGGNKPKSIPAVIDARRSTLWLGEQCMIKYNLNAGLCVGLGRRESIRCPACPLNARVAGL